MQFVVRFAIVTSCLVSLCGANASFVLAVEAPAAESILPADKATKEFGDNLLWYDIRELGVEGRGWDEGQTKTPYDRLPGKAEGVVRPPVWNLSQDSAGMLVRFRTNATQLSTQWTLRKNNLAMPHMPATGVSGLDLYVRDAEGKLRWVAIAQPHKAPTNKQSLFSNLESEWREFWLYLPLYNGVQSVYLGIPAEAQLAQAEPWSAEQAKPMLFYGTSITQGGCASRPGMPHPAILGRRLNRPTINLGFSGNGIMEPEVAQLLAELDPSVYVIDCLPNMNGESVAERVEPLVKTLRAAHPETPIVLVEDRTFTNAHFKKSLLQFHAENRAALKAGYEHLLSEGVTGLYYVPGETLLAEDGEGTVDGSHPTDLGFVQQADALEPTLKKALAGEPQ